jgi:hypothetical protein
MGEMFGAGFLPILGRAFCFRSKFNSELYGLGLLYSQGILNTIFSAFFQRSSLVEPFVCSQLFVGVHRHICSALNDAVSVLLI